MIGVLASVVDGVLVGAVYGLAAMGLTLIWGVMNVINLSHGAIIVLGMFVVYFLTDVTGVSAYYGIPIVIVAGSPSLTKRSCGLRSKCCSQYARSRSTAWMRGMR